MTHTNSFHRPVLLPEVLSFLNVRAGEKYIDATIGGGGYTDEILERGGRVLGIDIDNNAIDYVRQKYQIGKELFLEQGNYANLKSIARKYGFENVNGIIFDLGMSSYQIDKSGRGFSFQKDEILDMRMGGEGKETAADILNNYSKEKLYEIFTSFSEELNSRAISDAIFRARAIKKFETTRDLVEVVDKTVGKHDRRVLARIFQAIRVSVNDELTNIRRGLEQALELLTKGGRLIVLSYQSLEDRLVKNFMKQNAQKSLVVITKDPIRDPGMRSVRLRVGEKC